MSEKKSGNGDKSSTQSATSIRRILTEKTLIADVVDYAIELHARERAELLARNPHAGGAPKWMIAALAVMFVAVAISLFTLLASGPNAITTDSLHRTITFVGAGVLVAMTLAVILVHSAKVAELPKARVEELVELDKKIKAKFDDLGLKCYGCGAAYVQTFEQGAKIHGYEVDTVIRGLRDLDLDLELTNPDRPLPTPDAPPSGKPTETPVAEPVASSNSQ